MRTRIPAPISAAVEQLGREQDASSYVVLTAGLVVMLHAATGSRDILIGFPIAGRSRPELERVVGCLVNAIPLRVAVEREAAFTELLAAVRCRVLEAQDNQDLPFDELVARLGITTPPGRSPLFDLGFTWEEPLAEQVLGHRASAHEVERLELEPLEVHVPAALWLYGHRQAGEFVLELAWDPAIYDDSTMQALLDGLVSIVSVATKDPRCSVTTLARASQATGRHDL